MDQSPPDEAIVQLSAKRLLARFLPIAAGMFLCLVIMVALTAPPDSHAVWVCIGIGPLWLSMVSGMSCLVATTACPRVTREGLEMTWLFWVRRFAWDDVVNILPPMLPWFSPAHEAMDNKHMRGIVLFDKRLVTDESLRSLKALHDRYRGQWPEMAERVFALYDV